ncbi:MAG: DUF2085 domain-containing protein [Candidatus Methanofastidiosia archaeon]
MQPKKVYTLFLLLSISTVALIILAPYLAYKEYTYFSDHIYQYFSSFCHQRPERSFFLLGYPLAVCARCTFIFIGILAGMVLYPLWFGKGVHYKTVIIFSVPVLVDGFTQVLFRESTNATRAATGFLLGIILPFYLMPKFIKALHDKNNYKDKIN